MRFMLPTARSQAGVQAQRAKVRNSRVSQIVCALTGSSNSLRVRIMSSYSKQSLSSLLRARLTSSYREFSSTDLRTVGNYTLGRLIGKGSFGKVYLATHKLTNGSKVRSHSSKMRIAKS